MNQVLRKYFIALLNFKTHHLHKPLQIESFQMYLDFINSVSQKFENKFCLFRGQPCDKPLIPKIGRLGLGNVNKLESSIFSDFQKRYIAYTPKAYQHDSDLLSLGQHFGLPTRLLDWTENSLMALWFATEKIVEEEVGVVWLFYPDENDIVNVKELDPFLIPSTKVFCPNHISERITAQSGWFTCHKLNSNNNFLRLENQKKYKDKLYRLLIPQEIFGNIKIQLNQMGVNSNTVFPDLNGLCKHLEWKHLLVS